MIGGHIQLAVDSMTTIWPQAKAGEVRPLAVSTPQRVAAAPDCPPSADRQGIRGDGWQGLYAPAGTPRPIVEKIAGRT